MSGRFLNVTAEEYHRDPCERPSLSASIANEINARSALHAWQIHPRFGGLRREPTEALDGGTLIHSLLLNADSDRIAVVPFRDFRTNLAKEARDAAITAGKVVVKAEDYEAAKEVAELLRAKLAANPAKAITFGGISEQAIEWTEPTEEHGEVLCRARLDHLEVRYGNVTEARILDVKTIRSADFKTCQRHIHEYGYDVQATAYCSAVGAVIPEALGRIEFIFVFVETAPPYAFRIVTLDGMFRHIGQVKWERACRVWARCLATKHWPGYAEQITLMDPPPWALTG